MYAVIMPSLPVLHSTDRNIIEAAGTGAAQSIKMVANIAANLIAFIALLAFVNNMLTWFGLRVGWDDPPLTFEVCYCTLFDTESS